MSDENELTEPERVSPSDTTVPNVPLPPRWPPAQQQFLRRDTFPLWATFLLIILAFVLVGGGLSLIFFTTTAQYRSSLISQATTTTLLTAQARATAQARVQATAAVFSTANANIYASATAQAAVTAASTVIATAYGNIFIQATTGTPALDDPLVDNSSNNGWDETNGTVAGQCVFTGNAYHVLSAQLGYFQPCFAEASNFSNFVYQVAMIIDKGNQGGILLRANSAGNAYYLFYIGIDGRYSLDIYKSGSKATTLTAGYSAAIVTGLKQTNQLAVIAFQGTLYLYANQQLITSVSNNTLSSGKIGVVALDFRNRTEVEFNNAQVWKITSSAFLNPTTTPTTTATATTTQTVTATQTATATPTLSP